MYKKVLADKNQTNSAKISLKQNTLTLSGNWTWTSIDESILSIVDRLAENTITVDGIAISQTDTTGMYFIHKLCQNLTGKNKKILAVNLKHEDELFFNSTKDYMLTAKSEYSKYEQEDNSSGDGVFSTLIQVIFQLIEFFGYLCYAMILFAQQGLEGY